MTPDGHNLADRLAIQRTQRANERTLLAYVRTSLVVIAAGAGIAEYIKDQSAPLVGILLMAAGAAILAFGVWRFVHAKRDLAKAANPTA